MASVDVLTPAGETAGSVELPDAVFDVQVNVPLIHQVVVGQLAAARQGTASVKTRAEVRGGYAPSVRERIADRLRPPRKASAVIDQAATAPVRPMSTRGCERLPRLESTLLRESLTEYVRSRPLRSFVDVMTSVVAYLAMTAAMYFAHARAAHA